MTSQRSSSSHKRFRRRTRTATSLFVLLQCLCLDESGCSVRAYTRTKPRQLLSKNFRMEPVTVEVQFSPLRPTQLLGSNRTVVRRHNDRLISGIAHHLDWIRQLSDVETATMEDCSTAAGPCEQCTDSERIMIPEACMVTGKRQPFHCYDSYAEGTFDVWLWTFVFLRRGMFHHQKLSPSNHISPSGRFSKKTTPSHRAPFIKAVPGRPMMKDFP